MPGLDKRPLGESLVEQGLITREQLQRAQEEGRRTGTPLKKSLIQLKFLTEDELVNFMSSSLSIPSVDLSTYLIKPEVLELVPETLARKYALIPIYKIGETLTVAMADPLNIHSLDELRQRCNCDVKPAIASEGSVLQALERYYGTRGSIDEIVKAIEEKGLPRKEKDIAEEPPVVKLVNLLVMQAIRDGASDVHIEPDRNLLRTRVRVDGVLHEVPGPPKHLQSAIISRVKILSNLDIAERRAPQDGRFQMKMENREVDIRVSIIPTIHGEKAVLRILDTGQVLLKLGQLGFSKELLSDFRKLILRPHGMILVTGPTGSGKTTTLYAALSEINSPEQNIVTIEDPVEYRLEMIQQMQVNPKADVTFANGLRSILRQDPDIIMVGEIRDFETAEIAVQAALTGHLVFSTLHTNDAPSAVARLIDMQVEPFLISSSLAGVIAQRLVRKVCEACREPYTPPAELAKEVAEQKPAWAQAKGCKKCMDTGYKGRVAIFELLKIDEAIRPLIVTKAPASEIRKAAQANGMKGLRADGLRKAAQGITTVEEVLRVTQEEL